MTQQHIHTSSTGIFKSMITFHNIMHLTYDITVCARILISVIQYIFYKQSVFIKYNMLSTIMIALLKCIRRLQNLSKIYIIVFNHLSHYLSIGSKMNMFLQNVTQQLLNVQLNLLFLKFCNHEKFDDYHISYLQTAEKQQ